MSVLTISQVQCRRVVYGLTVAPDSGDTDTLQGTPPRQTHSLIQAQTPRAAPEHHTTRAISVDNFIPLTVRLHDAGAVSHKEFADLDTRRATAMNWIVYRLNITAAMMMSVSRFDSEVVLFFDCDMATAFKYRHS